MVVQGDMGWHMLWVALFAGLPLFVHAFNNEMKDGVPWVAMVSGYGWMPALHVEGRGITRLAFQFGLTEYDMFS